jgi:hypothetical protein
MPATRMRRVTKLYGPGASQRMRRGFEGSGIITTRRTDPLFLTYNRQQFVTYACKIS